MSSRGQERFREARNFGRFSKGIQAFFTPESNRFQAEITIENPAI